ncbi:hypothetical protein BRSPCE3_69830 [Bradyrhizobium sp. Ce-3]|nr:hypothetical protein BRSPCE3_69830 [Bradyrhizobium sp. Ce-3]
MEAAAGAGSSGEGAVISVVDSEVSTLVRLPLPLRERVGRGGAPGEMHDGCVALATCSLVVATTTESARRVAPLSLTLPRKGGREPFRWCLPYASVCLTVRATNSLSSLRKQGPITTTGYWCAKLERRVPFTTAAAACGSLLSQGRQRCGSRACAPIAPPPHHSRWFTFATQMRTSARTAGSTALTSCTFMPGLMRGS